MNSTVAVSHSDSWVSICLRTWSGTITLTLLWKRPSRGCISFASWGCSTCHRSCWNSSGSAILESVLCSSITVWFGSATKSDIKRLLRTVRNAERIIGAPLPSLQELYTSRVRKRAKKITLDPSHPAHSLFELMPPGLHYRAMCTKTARHKNSFFPPGHIPPEQHITHLSTGHPYTTQQIFFCI